MMQGVWLLPTRRRIEKLTRFVNQCIKTGMSTPVIILVEASEYEELKAEYDALPIPAFWKIWVTKADGLGDKVRELWPWVSRMDWVGLVCDDHLPQTYLWDRLMLERMTGKNMVSCDDGELAPYRAAGAILWGGELIRTVGYMIPDTFWHAFMDNVWEDLGRITGCWDQRLDVLVCHDHGFKAEIEQDATHDASYDNYQADEMAYAEWRLTDYIPALKRISAMQGFAAAAPEKKRSFFDNLKSLVYKPRTGTAEKRSYQ